MSTILNNCMNFFFVMEIRVNKYTYIPIILQSSNTHSHDPTKSKLKKPNI